MSESLKYISKVSINYSKQFCVNRYSDLEQDRKDAAIQSARLAYAAKIKGDITQWKDCAEMIKKVSIAYSMLHIISQIYVTNNRTRNLFMKTLFDISLYTNIQIVEYASQVIILSLKFHQLNNFFRWLYI